MWYRPLADREIPSCDSCPTPEANVRCGECDGCNSGCCHGSEHAIARGINKKSGSATYDSRTVPDTPLADCEAAVGKRARLVLTGTIVSADERENGGFVYFELDERWGFPEGTKMGMDLEAFEIEEQ